MDIKPYRPHTPGHDYYEQGAYLITLVVAGRAQFDEWVEKFEE